MERVIGLKNQKNRIMANIEKLAPIIFRWEGGYVNDKDDHGGATNMGVTISTWKKVGYDKDGDGDIDKDDVKLITKDDVLKVLRIYWDRWKADEIKSQSIANILVDWVWGSGKWGIVHPQRLLGVVADGIVGKKTLAAVNGYENQKELFNKIKARREKHFRDICANDPTQKKYLKGWLNRLASFNWIDE